MNRYKPDRRGIQEFKNSSAGLKTELGALARAEASKAGSLYRSDVVNVKGETFGAVFQAIGNKTRDDWKRNSFNQGYLRKSIAGRAKIGK